MPLNREVARLFGELLELTSEQRLQFFQDHSVPPEIRREVESLLAFDRTEANPIEPVVERFVGIAALDPPRAGQFCGPYRLLRLIGRGGMGVVYLAERDDGEIRQQAAIKLLRASVEGSAGRRRFLQERQILADLKHPNIARLMDAGHTEDGQPYLVMEYVEGRPVDKYAAELSLGEKVALMIPLCEAVSFAHQNLIVHRDLKPANILVDRSGTVKLLDFGIAKLVDMSTDATATIERRLTPAYASPEQIQGKPVTTSSDIYSLGAVLYAVLTGSSPFDAHGEMTPAELATVVCEGRITPPGERGEGIDRDLDAIVLKAMRKEPQERYGTADQLAEDLHAWLDHRPVRARQGDWWYSARRAARRYWAPITAATVAIAGLSAGLLIALKERDVAERRFREVRQLSGELFNVESDISKLAGSTAARERIVRTSLQYLEQLSKETGNDLELKSEIAAGYRKVANVQGVFRGTNLGHPEEARASLRKAEALSREVFTTKHNDRRALKALIETLDLQGRLDFASKRMNDLEARTTELKTLLASFEQMASRDEAELTFLATTYESIAIANREMTHMDEAAAFAKRSADMRREVLRFNDSPDARGALANSLASYGQIARGRGLLEEAVQAQRESLALLEGIVAADPNNFKARLNVANISIGIGRTLGDVNAPSLGRTDEAIESFQRGLRIGRDVIALDPKETQVRFNQSIGAWRLGDALRGREPAAAVTAYDEAIDLLHGMAAKSFNRDVPLAVVLAESTFPLRSLHREEEARRRLAEAKRIAAGYAGVPSPASAICNEAITRAEADWAVASGRPNDAIQLHRQWLLQSSEERPSVADQAKEDLAAAFILANRYRLLAEALRSAGQEAGATEAEGRRRALIMLWKSKLQASGVVEAALSR